MLTLSAQIANWDKIVGSILEAKLLEKTKNKTEMISQDATTRYLSFLESHENASKYAQLSHIASYLGITQFSLSRIRKKIHQHDFLPNGKN
jgi:CRP-like cAMP-binding protein